METDRPTTITITTALLVLLSLANIATIGAPSGEDGIPLGVIWASVVLGLAGLVAAVGLWRRRRWGMMTALVVLMLTVVSTAPAIVFAPSTELRVGAILTLAVVGAAAILLVLPNSRSAFA